MTGTLYGVGVGPGDPELMTLKAARLIRQSRVIALPGRDPKETAAYRIAAGAVPELAEKELLPIPFPMVMDKAVQEKAHREGAALVESYLARGEDVVFLTLGDVTVYSTFSYLQNLVTSHGYPVSLVSGIPSFCAAAARLGLSIGLWNEPIHILPGIHYLEEKLPEKGTLIFMKAASKMAEVKQKLTQSGREIAMVENCGMEDERVYHSLAEIPDTAGYFSLIIAREARP